MAACLVKAAQSGNSIWEKEGQTQEEQELQGNDVKAGASETKKTGFKHPEEDYILPDSDSHLCDYCTKKELNSEQRKRYCNFIIDIATEDHKNVTKKYIATLVNNDAKIIKRRISELKKYGGPKKLFLSCFLGGIICVTGSVTSFAYNPPAIYNTTDATDTNTEIMVYNEVPPQLQADILPYDNFLADMNGSISEIKDSNPKAYCLIIMSP